MSAIDVSHSNNSRGSAAWSQSWTHFSVDRRSPGYCRVTFEHPPINTITATTVAELERLGRQAELQIRRAVKPGPDILQVLLEVPECERHGPKSYVA